MRTVALSLALLAAATAPALAEKTVNTIQFEIQMATSDAQNAAKIKRTFDLAAKQRGRQAIEISCAPGDSHWCTKEFVAACDNHDGGMSTNPDGSVTCSFPAK